MELYSRGQRVNNTQKSVTFCHNRQKFIYFFNIFINVVIYNITYHKLLWYNIFKLIKEIQ